VATGLTLAVAALTLLTPTAAFAVLDPPGGGSTLPAPTPVPVIAPAHAGLPAWAIAVIVAGSMLIAVATSLATITYHERRHQHPLSA
jgi:hypothetical protein